MSLIWKMRNGEEIELSKMSDSHIKKAYRMLKRKGFIGPRH